MPVTVTVTPPVAAKVQDRVELPVPPVTVVGVRMTAGTNGCWFAFTSSTLWALGAHTWSWFIDSMDRVVRHILPFDHANC